MNEAACNCFWAPPIQQFVFGKRAEVLAWIGSEASPAPGICCGCGNLGSRRFPLKIQEASKAGAARHVAEMLGGGLDHVGTAIFDSDQRRVSVLVCSSCQFLHRLGFVIGFIFVAATIAALIAVCAMDQESKSRMPLWADLAFAPVRFVVPATALGSPSWCGWKAVPVSVYRTVEGGVIF